MTYNVHSLCLRILLYMHLGNKLYVDKQLYHYYCQYNVNRDYFRIMNLMLRSHYHDWHRGFNRGLIAALVSDHTYIKY